MNEIKIPDGCKSIKIDKESDNKIVITFEPEKQEWKNGDIVSSNGTIAIFKSFQEDGDIINFYAVLYKSTEVAFKDWFWVCGNKFILATDQQREELFAALEKEGYRWNAEKLEIEKIEWEPVIDEECWRIDWNNQKSLFFVEKTIFSYLYAFSKLIKKTEKEAQALCDKLNAAIN